MDSWFKLKGIELGFITNPNKSWCLGCVWVITKEKKIGNFGRFFGFRWEWKKKSMKKSD